MFLKKYIHSIRHFSKNLTCRRKISYATEQERDILLSKLSSSSADELNKIYLSPLLIKKIIDERNIMRRFTSLAHFRECGIDDRKVKVLTKVIGNKCPSPEKLQEIIYSMNPQAIDTKNLFKSGFEIVDEVCTDSSDSNKTQTNVTRKQRKSVTIPKFDKKVFNINRIIALNISFSHLAWTYMDADQEILDMSSACLFIDDGKVRKNVDLHEFYEKVLLAVKQIPEYDLIVVEDQMAVISNSVTSRLLPVLKGMLLSLLDTRKQPSDPHPLIYLKKSVVSKLYNLNVGTERASSLDIGESILAGGRKLNWMVPLYFQSQPLLRYILSSHEERRQMIESLLLAIAFDQVVLKENVRAMLIL